MPSALTYPGVYIEEMSSGVRTIVGVATSITAFVGRARRGPVNKPVTINCFGDFEREFGGLWAESTLGYAVRDFFLNGGTQAIIVRLFSVKDDKSRRKIKFDIDNLTFEAASEGSWGTNLRVSIDVNVSAELALKMGLQKENLFNITIRDLSIGGKTEQFLNVSVQDSPRRIDNVLRGQSKLLRWRDDKDNTKKHDTIKDPSLITNEKISAAHTALNNLNAEKKTIPPDPAKIKLAQADLNKALACLGDPVSNAEYLLALAITAKKEAEKIKDDAEKAKQDEIIKTQEKSIADLTKNLKESASDGGDLTSESFTPDNGQAEKKGLFALEDADLFNLLCIPPYTSSGDVDTSVIGVAAAYCEKRRAMLLIDPPSGWTDKSTAKEQFTAPVDSIGTRSKNAALFYPRLVQANPLNDNQLEEFSPCGTIAGVFARTDAQRGVWKAPAGLEATLVGTVKCSEYLSDAEIGELNPLGINCLRTMPGAGRVVWGSRTLQGNDILASEWKYIPVRRLALYIEESLYRGSQWIVFEPNDEPLWAQIRLNLGSFMHRLFRQGAFAGSSPRDAYFVKCDKETTPPEDVNLGIVNIIVGFAPLKPAEFVIIKMQQIAGQIQT